MFYIMEDIVANDICVISGKYHGAICIFNHVIMANHICGLGLQHWLFL
jgi:hypothetical protein